MALTPGTRLGPYKVAAQIGVGGMGEVYKATDTNLKRAVAIKVLPASVVTDAERLARFQREAEVLASLNHPNIAQIHGIEKSGGTTALVMELVEGPTLADRIAQGAMPLDEAVPIAKQIAEALETAHEQGIVHRDLKPANIKVRPDGTVKVLDFGLAKAIERAGEAGGAGGPGSEDLSQSPTITTPAMTQAGMILGTAAYMSPEQARGKRTDRRADIWAYGCVLFEMLTRRRAFPGEDVTDTLAAVVRAEPEWSLLPSTTPAAVRRLLRRCLEKDPRQRLQAIGEARILFSQPLEEERAAVAVPSRPPLALRLVPWALAGVFLLTALGVSLVHLRETPPPLKSLRFQVSGPENSGFRLSPDGRHLVFVATGGGPPRLWIRSLDSVSATPLAGTDGATYPFWSPDSTRIGFFAQGKLKTIPAAGGLAVSLCDAVSGRGGAWNRDGVILFAPDVFGGIQRVADTGGTPVAVTTSPDPTAGDRYPEFLPDGERFLFLRATSEQGGLYAGTLSDGSIVRILPEISNAAYVPRQDPRRPDGFLIFRRDNALMAQPFDPDRLQTTGGVIPIADQVSVAGNVGYGAFTASQDGTVAFRSGIQGVARQLVWLDRTGKRLGAVGKPDEIGAPALSPDGKMVVFSIGNPTAGAADLWLQNLETGVLSRFTFAPGAEAGPVWSPDGSRIAFHANPSSSTYQIQQQGVAAAGQPEIVLQGPYSSIGVGDWSRDGRLIVFSNRSDRTQTDLWLLPMEGDRKAVPFLQSPAAEAVGRFSPDSQWLAYQSDESGRNEIYVQHVPQNGSKFQVSAAGGVGPRWSRDGTELFYLEGQNLMTVPVKVGAAFTRGPARRLLDGLQGNYQPSADGQRFLALLPAGGDAQPNPITVVTNWEAMLKQ